MKIVIFFVHRSLHALDFNLSPRPNMMNDTTISNMKNNNELKFSIGENGKGIQLSESF